MRRSATAPYGGGMKQNSFRVVALDTAIAETARRRAAEGAADHQRSIVHAERSAPCRHCLRWAQPGESVVLFPFPAIAAHRPYAESGPIFVHAEACPRYATPAEFPADLRQNRVARAYNRNDEIVAAELAGDDLEATAERLLADEAVEFLHVRSASHGCYTFKVERA